MTFQHTREILLIEDTKDNYRPMQRWLERKDYRVTLATDLATALAMLDTHRFHLAIVDIRLDETDENNEDGFEFLKEVAQRGLNEQLPRIVLTNYGSERRIYEATQIYGVERYLNKGSDYLTELLEVVEKLFAEKVHINFDLAYEGLGDSLIPKVAPQIRWDEGPAPPPALLVAELHDLFGRLFHDATRIFLNMMKPGLTGAVVVRVRPTWTRGPGPSHVLKISRREKVALEADRYHNYVEHYIPPNRIELVQTAYSRHLGVLQYTFAGGDVLPLKEFDAYYKREAAENISHSLQQMFETTCRYWYGHKDNTFRYLPDLYLQAFELELPKLIGRIREVVPHFDPAQEQYEIAALPFTITNPLRWMERNQEALVMEVNHCITHGDLTGRNIMVSDGGDCWLIDFYRTYPSHILRDFVIMETDIKYRLMPELPLSEFIDLEEYLLLVPGSSPPVTLADLAAPAQKAATVIQKLRQVGEEYAHRPGEQVKESRQEYWLSLLMATLNVARLRHIKVARKQQALLSAGMICDRLDILLEGR